MPAYNAERTVRQAVGSVLRQSYTDLELLIIDDASRDATGEAIREYCGRDGRISCFTNPQNLGAAASRMRGIARARGEWIAFLDSDDLWRPEKLERQAEAVRRLTGRGTPPDLVFTGSAFLNGSGAEIPFRMEVPETVTYRELLKQNVISCSSVLVRKELLLKYPMEGDGMHEDYAVWLRILKNGGRAYGINKPLLVYRLSGHSRSGDKRKAARMTYGVYRYMGLGPARSCYYFCCYARRNLKKYRAIRRADDLLRKRGTGGGE